MRETIFLRAGKRDDYPLPESLRSIARDRDSCWDFELASDDPRWGDILEFCALQADRERARDEERQAERARLGLPRFWLPGGDELDAAIKDHIVSRGWTIPAPLPYYWVQVRRHYAPRELRAAQALHWIPWETTSRKRPYEMNREIYDWDRQCRMCLAAPQKAPLLFTRQWFPRTKDVLRVGYGSEVVVSDRFARVLEDTRVTGCATRSVFERRPGRGSARSLDGGNWCSRATRCRWPRPPSSGGTSSIPIGRGAGAARSASTRERTGSSPSCTSTATGGPARTSP